MAADPAGKYNWCARSLPLGTAAAVAGRGVEEQSEAEQTNKILTPPC